MSRIRFEIVPPVAHPEELIRLVGNLPALGDWHPAAALALRWEPPVHAGEIDAETGTAIEFKALRENWESEAVDAWGHVPENWRSEVWLDATICRTVPDWKDRYAGRLMRDRVPSRILAGSRDLLIWLPPSYPAHPERRYPVLIMHDGQNVFDPDTSRISGVDWAADERVRMLAAERIMPETIVVGVVHPEGFAEGMTSLRDVDLSPELGGAAYAEFVATELVTHLDERYRTLTGAENRLLAGAALGGLNAFYTAIHHPGIFGKFACLSSALGDQSQSPPEACGQLRALEALPAMPQGARMYFDYGTLGLDATCEPCHRELASLLRAKGWKDGREFRIIRVVGASPGELSWRDRLGDALAFLCAQTA